MSVTLRLHICQTVFVEEAELPLPTLTGIFLINSHTFVSFRNCRLRSFVLFKYRLQELRDWTDSVQGGHNIRDNLTEVLVLSDVNILVAEWIPFGSNQVVSLNLFS